MNSYDTLRINFGKHATEDESMAIEALSQLSGYPCIETKTSFILPLFNCPTCNQQFGTTADLQNHQVICNITQYKCPVCGVAFLKQSYLSNHLICHAVDKPLPCSLCGILCTDKSELLKHLKYSHGEAPFINQCQICGVIFNRPSSLSNHLKIHNYQPGRAVNKNTNEDVEKILEEENTDKSYLENKTTLPSISNIKTNNWMFYDTLTSATNISEKKYTCLICNTNFHQKKVFKLHEKIAHCSDKTKKKLTSTKHTCCECGKRFATKQKVQRHLWIHRKKLFSCEICCKNFHLKEDLDSHRIISHPPNSRTGFTCKDCGKNFISRQGLWEHGRLHSSTAASSFLCLECSKTFSSRQGYLIHKRIHSNERPYGCKFCDKAFRDGGTLRKHELIHTGERPHNCPICPKAFNQKVVLREHVRWLHVVNIECNDGQYECPVCKEIVFDKDELCSHIVRHSDKKSKNLNNNKNINFTSNDNCFSDYFECEVCKGQFLNKNDLMEHINVHI